MTAIALVVESDQVAPSASEGEAVSERPVLGAHTGSTMLEQSLLESAPGRSTQRFTGEDEEVLFVLEGRGLLNLGSGEPHQLEAESGAYLPPGQRYEIANPGPGLLRIVRVQILEPEGPSGPAEVRRLDDQLAQAATTQREFRIVASPRSATHFVGYIPAVRAPEHFHTYDEVIYVLEGEGALHADGQTRPVRRGSCIQLPARTVHCLENTGRDTMRVVAVFRPGGSPAAAYYPDGTPAHADAPPLGEGEEL
ncbi:MAG: cupin domain-containing protein [Solirubrobacterales bacterium]|nr:cupin domain-containing protein [Solirubrobacterales bacterium]